MDVQKLKMRACQRIISLLLLLCASLTAYAQQIKVHGVVTDPTGETVIGANVVIKGTTNGVATDLDGNYELTAGANDVLVISYIGYKLSETPVKGRREINIMLEEDAQNLEETVVVGYGSLSKKELSSSIVQVDKSQFSVGAMNNAMEMLSGKVAGLNVNTTAAANPNSSSSLQVRGATSLTASNDPLIVIDGVAGGDIRNLSPQDIESMTVLKDAGSAAIYGTRGANGVILITTKKGSGDAGTVHLTYDSYVAVNIAKAAPEVLSADEFRRSRRGTDYGYETDWYDAITRDAAYDMNQYIALDGSTKNGWYSASFNYKQANGLDIVSARKEFGARFATEQKFVQNRLTLGGSLSTRRVNETWGNDGLFDTALGMNPTLPIKNPDGTYYQPTGTTGASNPVANLELNTNNGQRAYILGTAEAKLAIINTERHMLNTSVSYSLHYNDLKSNFYSPSTSSESFWGGYNGRASMSYQKWITNRFEWLGNYTLNLEDHNIKTMVGYTWERSDWENLGGENRDFAYDNTLYWNLGSGTWLSDGKASLYSGASESTLIGFFGRVNYNWKNQLFVSASFRREGSTKFGKNNKWGNFPAISAAYDLMSAPFMQSVEDIFTSIKPRISYGVTGRSDFSSYRSLATYSTRHQYFMDGQWIIGYAPSVNANAKLGWEKGIAINYGVDFSLWNNRLNGSIEYFDRRSEDLLYNYTAPQPPYVYSTILVNVGSTQNTGLELSLNGDILTKTPVKWSMGMNWSMGETKLSKLSSDIYKASYLELYQKPGVGTSEYFFRVEEGGKVGQFYGYEYAGVDEMGNMLVYDKDNNPVVASKADPTMKRRIGNGAPKHFLNITESLRYKQFDLTLAFRGAFGFDIFNMRKYGMGLAGCGTDNVLRTAYTDDKALTTGGGVISSYFLESGNYIKLDNATLGWNFIPKNRSILENLRLFVSAKNLFTITGYSGNDPSIVGVNGITPSVDTASAYPQAIQLSFGITAHIK